MDERVPGLPAPYALSREPTAPVVRHVPREDAPCPPGTAYRRAPAP
ncbi:hypothetical protein NKH77_44605 [Streptomyces sp. M19]